MRILFLCSSRSWGGNEKWTHMAAHTLKKRGHSIFLAYRRATVGDRFATARFALPFIAPFDLWTLWRLVRIIQKEQIEILIPTKRKDYILAGLAAWLTGRKSVLRLGAKRRISSNPYNRLLYGVLTHGIIVNAEATKEVLTQSPFIAPDKILAVHNGLDLEELKPIEAARLRAKPYGFMVLSMGRLSKNKGFDFLLRAFADFVHKSGRYDAGVVILGDGQERDNLLSLAQQLKIADQVHLAGFVQDPKSWLQIADIYVQSSKNEGISNALLEAMYLTGPVVATRAGGTGEVVFHGRNGFLIEYPDIEALSGHLTLLSDDDLRVSVALEAKLSIAEHFSLDRMAKRVEEWLQGEILIGN